jgi:nitroimidazol reductase NimA-like FMN-containing flavoprotein (pyridoxamine 5'-phosphate oxidase superfamily)
MVKTGSEMSDPPGEGARSLGRAGARASSPGVLELSEEECWTHLRAQRLGRLAIVMESHPQIFPVNYATGEKAVVFRTDPGGKLAHGPGSVACFEIDGYDSHSREGWSVTAVGPLEDITTADDAPNRALRELHVDPLAPGARLHWIALHAEKVTGRRFAAGWVVPGVFFG